MRADQLEQAVALQDREGIRLGEALVRLGYATEDDVAWALSTQLGLPYVHLTPELVDPAALQVLPVEHQRRLGVVPLLVAGEEVAVAVADPTDTQLLAEVERLCGLRPSPVVALASNIQDVLERVARAAPPPPNGDLALRLALSHAAQNGASHVYVVPVPGRRVWFSYRTPAGVFPVEAPRVPWEFLARAEGEAGPAGELHLEVVLADRAAEAVLQVFPTRWGPALAGRLLPSVADPARDDAGLPMGLWAALESSLSGGGLVVLASPDRGLRGRLLRSVAARLASRQRGLVVLAGAGGSRQVPGVVESPPAEAARWQQVRPDALVVEGSSPEGLHQVLLASWPGQKLVVGLPAYGTRHARAALPEFGPPLRAVLAAVAVPALCSCADVHQTPYAPWPAPDPPTRWGSARGCEACRHTGFAGEAVVVAWEPAAGACRSMASSARELVESLRAAPESVIPVLEV